MALVEISLVCAASAGALAFVRIVISCSPGLDCDDVGSVDEALHIINDLGGWVEILKQALN